MNLPFVPDLKTAAIVALIVGVAAFGGGYKVADWRLTGQYTAEKLKASQDAAKALADMTADRDLLAGKLSVANDKHTNELRNAQNETNRLRDRLANSSSGLRIAATCPESRLGPQAASGVRVDTGTGAELDSTARRAYFALRDGIDRASAQLAACPHVKRTPGG
ncbi:MAG: lysis protein [Acidobacteria bacterium]|nr:lysis protein [Acidobacteriota bacterium]